jgi:hypothetical protein
MRYAQHRSGQKLHIVYDLGDLGLTQPICGRVFKRFRMTINAPLGHCCRACMKREVAASFDKDEFISQYFVNKR